MDHSEARSKQGGAAQSLRTPEARAGAECSLPPALGSPQSCGVPEVLCSHVGPQEAAGSLGLVPGSASAQLSAWRDYGRGQQGAVPHPALSAPSPRAGRRRGTPGQPRTPFRWPLHESYRHALMPDSRRGGALALSCANAGLLTAAPLPRFQLSALGTPPRPLPFAPTGSPLPVPLPPFGFIFLPGAVGLNPVSQGRSRSALASL